MQLNTNAQKRHYDAHNQRGTMRTRQADRYEMLVAASEAEDICPIWITDRLSERERVSP
ncbi:MAG: hypothetical protein AB8B47_03495 [Roseobacter sp.]